MNAWEKWWPKHWIIRNLEFWTRNLVLFFFSQFLLFFLKKLGMSFSNVKKLFKNYIFPKDYFSYFFIINAALNLFINYAFLHLFKALSSFKLKLSMQRIWIVIFLMHSYRCMRLRSKNEHNLFTIRESLQYAKHFLGFFRERVHSHESYSNSFMYP